MHRLICTFVVRIWLKQVFSWRGSNYFIFARSSFFFFFAVFRPTTGLQRLKFATHDVFLFKFFIWKCFARILNSQGPKFANISKDKNSVELPHDKTNKMACAPSEDSDQPGHLPSLIRVFAVRMMKAWTLSYPLSAQRRLWSDWADAMADLSLRWAHMPFCWFCHEAARLSSFNLSHIMRKCVFRGVRPGGTQTGLLRYRG